MWTISKRGYKGAHFATFPPELIDPCILAAQAFALIHIYWPGHFACIRDIPLALPPPGAAPGDKPARSVQELDSRMIIGLYHAGRPDESRRDLREGGSGGADNERLSGIDAPTRPAERVMTDAVSNLSGRDSWYDVSPDGKRFLMLKTEDAANSASRIVVVQNWINELKQLAPAK